MATFSERLNEALVLRDMTAADLSKMTGISDGAISQYRKGKYRAAQRHLDALATALNVSIPWLMGLTEEVGTRFPEKGSAPTQAGERSEEDDWNLIRAFLETLPPEQLRGILLAVGAPKELLDELNQQERRG